jgi:hypothetical protein
MVLMQKHIGEIEHLNGVFRLLILEHDQIYGIGTSFNMDDIDSIRPLVPGWSGK